MNGQKKKNSPAAQGRQKKAEQRAVKRRANRAPGLKGSQMVDNISAAPAAMSRVRVSNRGGPQVSPLPGGGACIAFEEYVQDIITSGTTLAFAASSFPVQPGISTLFAWLADQAINFQEYRFRKISFRFETDQSTAVAGKVMYAFSPDAGDPIPVNKQEMLEYGVKGKSAVWQEFELPVPIVEALGARRYIRSGNLAANLDIKTYDIGTLFVASSGVVATSANIGELYVRYEVELMTPVVQSLAKAQALSCKIASGGTVSTTAQFGTAATVTNGLPVTVDATGNVLTFNRVGNYIVAFGATGTGLFTTFTIPAGTQSGLAVTIIAGVSNAAANAGTIAQSAAVFVVVSSRGATWTLGSWAAIATTITSTSARIAVFSEV